MVCTTLTVVAAAAPIVTINSVTWLDADPNCNGPASLIGQPLRARVNFSVSGHAANFGIRVQWTNPDGSVTGAVTNFTNVAIGTFNSDITLPGTYVAGTYSNLTAVAQNITST